MKKLFLIFIIVFVSFNLSFAGKPGKIGIILEFQKQLDLSKKQVDKLNQLRIQMKKDMINQNARLKIMEVDLKELFRDKENNLDKIKQKLTEKYQLKAKMEFSKVENEVKAIKLLSEEQKSKFGQLMEKWHHKPKMEKTEKHYNIKFIDEDGKVHHIEGNGDVDLEKIKKEHGLEWHGDHNIEEIEELHRVGGNENVEKKIIIEKEIENKEKTEKEKK